jgi:Putative adhesin
MPTFDTPGPISATVEIGVGDIRITASDRSDTTVEVRPTDAGKKSDVAAAEQTRVEYSAGRLLVKAPRRRYSLWGGRESVDVQIELPAGSHLQGEAGVAALRCGGALGECRFKIGVGEIQLGQAGPVQLRTGGGDITVQHGAGHAEITTGSGAVQVGSIDGSAVIKNSNGDTWVGEAGGDLRVNAANGKVSVDQAHASVTAKTANGDIRIGAVERGEILAQTAFGQLDIGIREGVAAWLDLSTQFGNVRNELDAAQRPGPDAETVEVRARTSYGGITIRRSAPLAPTPGQDRP